MPVTEACWFNWQNRLRRFADNACGWGGKRRDFCHLLRGTVDQGGELRGFFERVVEHELEARSVPEPQAPAHFASQEGTCAGEPCLHLFGRVFRGEGREEHPRRAEVRV